MKMFILIMTILIFANPAKAGEWNIIWSDEFDYQGFPDKNKWDYEEGFIRNKEMQYYTRNRKENARVENGTLVIEGRKEKFRNPMYNPNSKHWAKNREFAQYTAASLITLNKASWLYGRIEVRAKMPRGKGVWPAIWMLGTNRTKIGWPKCGEIDIMEYVGKEPNNIYATVHWPTNDDSASHKARKHQSQGGRFIADEPYKDFHLYAVQWYPDRMDFFFDENKYFTYKLDQAGKDDNNPFRKNQYLLINLALGGSWGGKIDNSILPQKYLIDYVRVYRKN